MQLVMISFLGEIHNRSFEANRKRSRKPEGEILNLKGDGKESDNLIERSMGSWYPFFWTVYNKVLPRN